MRYRYGWLFALLIGISSGCRKDWLDQKPSRSLVVPATLEDLQALLDNDGVMNFASQTNAPNFAEMGTDNYFVADATVDNLAANANNAYLANTYRFDPVIFTGSNNVLVWNLPYRRVFYSNVVLDGVARIPVTAGNEAAWRQVQGTAFFIRAYNFFWIAQLFAEPYDPGTAASTLGIPLRLDPNVNTISRRVTVAETYDQIIADLKQAMVLLPATSSYVIRATQAAAFGLLARTYLSMRRYDSAAKYADLSLQQRSTLLDYNGLPTAATFPVPPNNVEMLYYDISQSGIFGVSSARVDSLFYGQYTANDLRKGLFFKPRAGTPYFSFNGSYDGTSFLFTGMSVDEQYVTRAECRVRVGDIPGALSDLNALREKRYQKAGFRTVTTTVPELLLDTILLERRKQLCFRGLRWMDLRRLNTEARYRTPVTRVINGVHYTLAPEERRYVYPIPDDVIRLTGMEQNVRP